MSDQNRGGGRCNPHWQNAVHMHRIHAYAIQTPVLPPAHHERALLYSTVAEQHQTCLNLPSVGWRTQGEQRSHWSCVRQTLEMYQRCDRFAQGFDRARCDDCGLDFLAAVFRKGRGVRPSCSKRRMADQKHVTLFVTLCGECCIRVQR